MPRRKRKSTNIYSLPGNLIAKGEASRRYPVQALRIQNGTPDTGNFTLNYSGSDTSEIG